MSGLSSFPPAMVPMDFRDIFLQFPSPSPLFRQCCAIIISQLGAQAT